jgi:hypothetical protein
MNEHEWREPDSEAFGASRRTTKAVGQRRCLRCLIWEEPKWADSLCSGRPGVGPAWDAWADAMVAS